MSWVLSTGSAKRHFRPAELYTDDAGAELLVDRLGLEFDHVDLSLNDLDDHDPGWWALGKLYAYRLQTEPFVHIDSDVFLWRMLPSGLESAPLLAQNPEYFTPGRSYYRPEVLEAALDGLAGSWLPPEWTWYRAKDGRQRAECCGVFGGNRTDFIRHYAQQAIRLVEYPGNQRGWRRIHDKIGHAILLEQYLLSACVEYERSHDESEARDLFTAYVFPCVHDAFDPRTAAQVGYTHLIGDAKRNPRLARRVEARVADEFPASYARIDRLTR